MSLFVRLRLTRLFLFCILALLFVGCASQLKKAESLLERGEVGKALQKTDEYLAENPGQIEWVEFRRKARSKWIDQSLLQVRLLRLGNNLVESEKLLLEIIHKQNLWALFPTGPVFSTQKEELDHLQKRSLQRIKASLQQHMPFRAQNEFFRVNNILSQTLALDTKPIQQAINEEGQKYCRLQFKKMTSQSFFTMHFLSNVCSFWKTSSIPKFSQNNSPFFKDLEARFQIRDWPVKEKDRVSQSLREAFMKTPWYHPHGSQVLKMQVEGSFKESIAQQPQSRMAGYTVSVPYEYTEIREVTPPAKGGWAFIELLGVLAGSDRIVTNNGDGTETLRETRYRTENRTYVYQVEEFIQIMNLDLNSRIFLGPIQIEFPYADVFLKSSDEHKVNFPEAGVYPKERILVKSAEWVEGSMVGLANALDEKLRDQWEKSFCVESLNSLEDSHRCLFGTRSGLPSTQNQALFQSYQIEFPEVRDLLESIHRTREKP